VKLSEKNLHPTEVRRGNYTIVAGERVIVKSGDPPSGIVFNDGSFLVIYEKWSKDPDELLGYRYHYQRPDDWFVRYNMQRSERTAILTTLTLPRKLS
jgi:uncharacterized protein DUF6516